MNIRREIKKALMDNDFTIVLKCYEQDYAGTLRALQMYVYGLPSELIRWNAIVFLGEL